MNLTIDEEMLALTDFIKDFFERRGDARAIVEATASSISTDRNRWTALCSTGLPTIRLDEPDGVGAGLLEVTAIAEEVGAVLLPEPATATIVLATAWDAHPQASELLGSLCDGSRITALCPFDAVQLSAAGAVWGQAYVPDDAVTEAVALIARDKYTTESAIVVLDKSHLPAPRHRVTVDPTRPTAMVALDGTEPVEVLRLTNSAADDVRRDVALLAAAELVGGMQRVLDQTVEYVKSREQFGIPIGSFQAIKHQLADMYVATEQGRAAIQFAAAECSAESGSGATAVASAARWVTGSAIGVFEDAIHLHGAMGYSWELGLHLHLRRALATSDALNRSSVLQHATP